MKPLYISSLSREPIRVPVVAKVNGLQIDPTAMTVNMAFLPSGVNPQVSDWKVGTWDVDATVNPIRYKAQVVVTANSLAPGNYVIWLWLNGSDQPIKQVGVLIVS